MDWIQIYFNTIQSKDPRQQTDISHHFKQAGHNGREAVQVHILDFIYAFPDTKCAAVFQHETEFKWIHRLRSQLPMGLYEISSLIYVHISVPNQAIPGHF